MDGVNGDELFLFQRMSLDGKTAGYSGLPLQNSGFYFGFRLLLDS
jgi:hypothetical protein